MKNQISWDLLISSCWKAGGLSGPDSATAANPAYSRHNRMASFENYSIAAERLDLCAKSIITSTKRSVGGGPRKGGNYLYPKLLRPFATYAALC